MTHTAANRFSTSRCLSFSVLLLALAACPSLLVSQDASEIIQRSEDAIKGRTSKGTFEMTVTTPSYTRTLAMDSWWVGNEKALIAIKSPKKEAGNKWLKIKNEMWSYLKNTETTIKIPPSMMLQSWNGSDFTNDDLVRESNLVMDYDQTVAGKDTIGGALCWKIRMIPHPDAPVVWGRIDYWVRTADYLPARQEYYDEKGALVRTMQFDDYKMMSGRKIPTTWLMVNSAKEGHSTEFTILDAQFDVRISDRIFSLRELERGL
jgi:outer membrane lipoprotein-sorting protein